MHQTRSEIRHLVSSRKFILLSTLSLVHWFVNVARWTSPISRPLPTKTVPPLPIRTTALGGTTSFEDDGRLGSVPIAFWGGFVCLFSWIGSRWFGLVWWRCECVWCWSTTSSFRVFFLFFFAKVSVRYSLSILFFRCSSHFATKHFRSFEWPRILLCILCAVFLLLRQFNRMTEVLCAEGRRCFADLCIFQMNEFVMRQRGLRALPLFELRVLLSEVDLPYNLCAYEYLRLHQGFSERVFSVPRSTSK